MAQGSTTQKVTATDLDIRDLTSASDSVAAAQSGTWNITNVSGSVSLPTGAATSAKQDSEISILTTIDSDTGTIAGAVSGTEMQVDIVGALPAGTNAIGKLAANSGVDIGDVDITSIVPGTGATNLGKAIDTATGATDTGVIAVVTRDDALSTLTPADGDNTQLRVDSTGALWIKPSSTITVDGSGVTQPVSNAGLTELAAAINASKLDVNIVSSDVATGGTSAADDADFTAGTTTGTPAMGVYESTPTSVTDGDLGTVGITAGRRLKTSATIDAALPAGTNAIGKLSANSGVDIGDVDVTSISAGDNIIGRVKLSDGTTVATVRELGTNDALNVAMVDGSGNQITSFGGGTQYTEADTDTSITGTAVMWEDTSDTLRSVSASKPLPVDVKNTTIAVTQSGTWDEVGINDSGNSITIDYNGSAISTSNAIPIQPPASGYLVVNESGAALTAVQLIDDTVYVDDADWTDNTSKHTLVGGVYQSTPHTVTDGDVSPFLTDANGRLVAAVTDNGGSLTVDGTVAATQSGTWNITNVSGTVSLPTGASTLAEQEAQSVSLAAIDASASNIDTSTSGILADTAAIQTSVELIDDAVYTDGTGTVTKGIAILGQDGTNPQAIKTDTSGELQIDVLSIAAGDNNIGNVDVVTVPSDPFGANADAAATAGSTGSMQAKLRLVTSQLDSIKTAVETLDNTVGGSEMQVDIVSAPTLTVNSHAVTNAGTFAVQVDGNALTSLQLIDDAIVADDATFTPATTKVMMAGFEADESSTDSVDEGDGGAARMTLDRKVITTIQPHTTGGLSVFNATSSDGATALTNSAQVIKASAGQLYGWYIYNPNSSAQFVQLYNTAAASVTVGTTSPLFMLTIPATSAANVEFTNGITFSNAGWSCAATSTAGGNGAPTTALDAVFFYK